MNDTEFKFNFATVLSVIVVIVNGYIAFMGMLWKGLSLSSAAVVVSIVGLITIISVYLMCRGKASRWNKWRVVEVLSGVIILIIGFGSTFPIGNQIRVVKDRERITNSIGSLCQQAQQLNEAYESYTTSRIAQYQQFLQVAVAGKSINPTDYNNYVAGAGGTSDSGKINNLVKSLESQLRPSTLKRSQTERNEWLNNASGMSIWNIKLPSVLGTISNEFASWNMDYVNYSTNLYPGEKTEPFNAAQTESSVSKIISDYQSYPTPSMPPILIWLISTAILLFPYYVTRRPLANRSSHR